MQCVQAVQYLYKAGLLAALICASTTTRSKAMMDPTRPSASGSFDVSWRHFQPSLAISGAGYFPETSGYNISVTPFVSKDSSYVIFVFVFCV